MLQFIEYVFSDPSERDDYYQCQYEFSGPAMRRLYERNLCGRFMGVEIGERLYGDDSMPLWDVVHLAGFTPAQMLLSVPYFKKAFRDAAESLGGPSAKEKIAKWEQQREKHQIRVRQNMPATIVAASL